MALARPKSRAKRAPRPRGKAKAKAKPKAYPRSNQNGDTANQARRPQSSGGAASGQSYESIPNHYAKVYLHVAEKPSVARELIHHLSAAVNTITFKSYSPYNRVVGFEGPNGFRGATGPVYFLVTSVTGHLMSMDFMDANLSRWDMASSHLLFTAPIHKFVPEKNSGLARTLKAASKKSTDLVLWLDCDREGENIAFEVKDVCSSSNARLDVHRAIFSSLARQDIITAVNTLSIPNPRLTEAVDARQEYDLRLGCIFTRVLTLALKQHLHLESFVSFGPCQFPTLRMVVDRFLEMQSFQSEAFWTLRPLFQSGPELTPQDAIGLGNRFLWSRGRVFDEYAAHVNRDLVVQSLDRAHIAAIDERPKSRWRPIPLTTVSMTTLASRRLRLASAQTMKVAEKLYQKGFISYPRTETEAYPATLDIVGIANSLTQHALLGPFASSLLYSKDNGRQPGQPIPIRAAASVRSGSRSDEAHPPIHPVKVLSREEASGIDADAMKIYELVARHFLATLADDARGAETKVTLSVGPENFIITGLMIHELNYLHIYAPYETWSAKTIPSYTLGQRIALTDIQLVQGATTAPQPYEEADLIGLMDRHGIGTDATMHEHIQTIQDRQYVKKMASSAHVPQVVTTEVELEAAEDAPPGSRFMPTPLGIALVELFRHVGERFEAADLSRIQLRSETEASFTRIAEGHLERVPTVIRHLEPAKAIHSALIQNVNWIREVTSQLFRRYRATQVEGPVVAE